MAHYRMYKLRSSAGGILKAKDIEARGDVEAMRLARADDDCPICEVWQGVRPIGLVDEEKPN